MLTTTNPTTTSNAVDIPFEPIPKDKAAVVVLSMKSELMIAIRDRIHSTKLSQSVIATLCGVYQPRVSALVNGYIDQFSIDDLIRIASRLDVEVKLTVGNKE